VIETILFDLDDTLIAELEWARSGWRVVATHIAAEVGREPAALEQLLAEAFARDRHHVFDQLAASLGLDDIAIQECIALYRESPRPLTVLQDADSALRFAASRRTAIVTDGRYETQSTKVAGSGVAARVEAVIYTDSFGPGHAKPSPTGFLAALRHLGTPPQTAIYVADNPAKDFIGPRALGMRSVQVKRANGIYAAITPPPGGEPDATVQSLHELEPLVLRWDAEPAGAP
jgi:putative hydrolase of the HAD superfamily